LYSPKLNKSFERKLINNKNHIERPVK